MSAIPPSNFDYLMIDCRISPGKLSFEVQVRWVEGLIRQLNISSKGAAFSEWPSGFVFAQYLALDAWSFIPLTALLRV